MTKISCEIINDIMPLYVEEIISSATKRMVEEHMEECLECRNKLKEMQKEINIPIDHNIATMVSFKKKLFQKKVRVIILSVIATFTFFILGMIYVTSPIPLKYDGSLIRFEKLDEGGVLATISKDVEGYYMDADPADTYHITLWKSLWSEYIDKGEERSIIINKNVNGEYHEVNSVYYYAGDTDNDGTIDSEDLLIYGKNMPQSGGSRTVTLPRLVLSYYFIIAFIIAAVSGVIYKWTKKHLKIRKIAEKIMLLAISYVISQICIKGLAFSSYYLLKDLSGIVLMMIPIFCILVMSVKLIRSKRA